MMGKHPLRLGSLFTASLFDMTGFEHARVRASDPTGFELPELVSDALSG
jgi:hypothetical protein